jgi:phage-related protein
MPNIVSVTVRVTNGTSPGLSQATAAATKAGDEAGKGFSEKFAARLGTAGKNSAIGGGLFAGLSSALAMAAPLGAAGLAVGAFGAVAIPIFENLKKSTTANQAAQLAYNHAVEKAKQSYDQAVAGATTAKQKTAALATEQKALDAAQLTLDQHTTKLSGSQQGLADQVTKLQTAWKQTQAAMAPVVLTVAKLGVGLLQSLMPALQALATAGAAVLTPLINDFAALVKSPFFTEFTKVMSQAAKQIGPLLGKAVTDLIKVLMQLFIQLMPAGLQILKLLLPAFVQLTADLIPGIVAMANATAIAMKWLQVHRLLLPVLALLTIAILALTSPIAAVVIAIAALVAAGLQLAKHWNQIWTNIKNWTMDGVHAVTGFFDDMINRIKSGFDHLAAPVKAVLVGLFTIWKIEWDLIAAVTKVAWSVIYNEIKTALDIIAAFFKVWVSVVTLIFRTAWDILAAIFKVFIAILTGNWTAALNAIKAVTGQVWNNIRSFLSGVWGDIRALATQVGNNVKNAVVGAWNSVYGATRSIWGNIGSFLRGIGSTIVGYFRNAGTWLYQGGRNIISGMFNGIRAVWNDVVNFFKHLASDILAALGIHSPPAWAIDAGKHIMNGIGIGMNQARKAATNAAKSVIHSVGGAFGGEAPPGSSAAGAQRYAADLLGAFGWPRSQLAPLISLWNQESGWRWNALNPSSGAYGIPQSLPADKMASAGSDWRTNPATQIRWGLQYIHDRYGSPGGAWAHEVANNWYDKGGWLMPGLTMAYNGTGRPERVLGPGDTDGGLHITLELGASFRKLGLSEEQLEDIRYTVRTKGGGVVQAAFGR